MISWSGPTTGLAAIAVNTKPAWTLFHRQIICRLRFRTRVLRNMETYLKDIINITLYNLKTGECHSSFQISFNSKWNLNRSKDKIKLYIWAYNWTWLYLLRFAGACHDAPCGRTSTKETPQRECWRPRVSPFLLPTSHFRRRVGSRLARCPLTSTHRCRSRFTWNTINNSVKHLALMW